MTLTSTEKKILVYNKMKRKGLTYEQACEELTQELELMNKQQLEKNKERRNKKTDFKTEFKKLVRGSKKCQK